MCRRVLSNANISTVAVMMAILRVPAWGQEAQETTLEKDAQTALELIQRGLGCDGFVIENAPQRTTAWRTWATEGKPEGQWLLGKCYELQVAPGRPIRNDNYREALQWYRRAADQGFAAAQVSLGRMYGPPQ